MNTGLIANLQKELTCPYEHQPLLLCQTLTPCGDKINETAAKTLLGIPNSEGCLKERKPCPVCKKPVTHHLPDQNTRRIAALVFNKQTVDSASLKPIELSSNLSPSKIPEADSKETHEANKIPYPGDPTDFKIQLTNSLNWDILRGHTGEAEFTNRDIIRGIMFMKVESDSYLEQFGVFGLKNGDIQLNVWVSTKHQESWNAYIKALGLENELTDPKKRREMFSLLMQHNEIHLSNDKLLLLQKLMNADKWTSVTPHQQDEAPVGKIATNYNYFGKCKPVTWGPQDTL